MLVQWKMMENGYVQKGNNYWKHPIFRLKSNSHMSLTNLLVLRILTPLTKWRHFDDQAPPLLYSFKSDSFNETYQTYTPEN